MSWKQTEKAVARKVGGKVEKASGAVFKSNDVIVRKPNSVFALMSIEVKTTTKPHFSISTSLLHKIKDKALRLGAVPALVVELTDLNGQKVRVWVFFEENLEFTDNAIIVPF